MTEDPRCCGSGTCILDAEDRCWCGQQWDGQTMCRLTLENAHPGVVKPTTARAQPQAGAHDDKAPRRGQVIR